MLFRSGKGIFTIPHGLRIDPAGNVWTTDVGSHQVMKFTQKGELLLTLGKKGQAGATRDTFNKPTDIASAICGERSRQKQRSRNTTRRDAYRMVYGLYLELEELKALRRRRIIPGIVDKRL